MCKAHWQLVTKALNSHHNRNHKTATLTCMTKGFFTVP
jgi:hypothetical protein